VPVSEPPPPSTGPKSLLEHISTDWPQIGDPVRFVLRYARAIHKYLFAILDDPHVAEEVSQDFLTRVVERGFAQDQVTRGRFRDYLKAAVRNAARSQLRRRQLPQADEGALAELPDPGGASAAADREWLAEWRQCLLERAWHGLESHERGAPDSLFYTVLRLSTAHPDEDSPALAARASQQVGRLIRPAAFRKQLSRARRQFAHLVVYEVKQTLEDQHPDAVYEELADLGLMDFVRDVLPADRIPPGRK
jgi:RNA polymerase sigma-70 factor (ECF subfamily)